MSRTAHPPLKIYLFSWFKISGKPGADDKLCLWLIQDSGWFWSACFRNPSRRMYFAELVGRLVCKVVLLKTKILGQWLINDKNDTHNVNVICKNIGCFENRKKVATEHSLTLNGSLEKLKNTVQKYFLHDILTIFKTAVILYKF